MAAPSSHHFECADCHADLGNGPTMPYACPSCGSTVVVIETKVGPSVVRIERECEKELCSDEVNRGV